MSINKKVKDRLFCFIFGREENKKWTLSLYNAVNNSSFENPDEISIETMENFLYMGMKNDVAFLIQDYLNLYEHQSTFNPNMPLRDLIYLGKAYMKYIDKNELNIYGSKLIKVPVPKFVVFYNGKEEEEDQILRLSDSFPENKREEADIEITVKFININFGHNKELMAKCNSLNEYSQFIDSIRKKSKIESIEDAVNHAIDEMPDTSEIKPFLKANRAEVLDMLFEEYDEAKVMELFRKEGRIEGREEGRIEGKEEGRIEGREEGRKEGKEEERKETAKNIARALDEGRINKEAADYLLNLMKES